MQNSSIIDITSNNNGSQLIGTENLNGNRLNDRSGFISSSGPNGNKFILEHFDESQLADEDSDSDDGVQGMGMGMPYGKLPGAGSANCAKPGKKTKGRVKIKMEFIENKLRRYTTFSKRKTGIMKKAYELSTLTGTQVMLLVASETGHVYTFATRKLQPMITSESGKALIQTCLNSPEAPPGSQMSMEQRMNPSGFEETELTYAAGEEEGKPVVLEQSPSMFPGMSLPTTENNHAASQKTTSPSSQSLHITQSTTSTPVTSYTSLPQATLGSSFSVSSSSPPKSSISMQLPTNFILPGTNITIPIPGGQHVGTTTSSAPQTLYRLPQSNQVISLNSMHSSASESSTATVQSVSLATPSALGSSTNSGGTAATPSILMYQTPQGVVYATPTAALNDRTIFNFQQPATAISVPQSDQAAMTGGQIITIPVPVSLANSTQMIQLSAPPQATQQTHPMEAGEIPHQPPSKKSRK
ncbi:serum response factor [Patella vulgata]|uniref:serum response factor n=1 Tax=Patella vulgata TaxID=6465 RepID=UPI0021803C7D|nr:serum response factor [Patella vulgata]